MSPAMPAFSSSSRSMRSIKLLSWSAATDSVLKAASSMDLPLFVVTWALHARMVSAHDLARRALSSMGRLRFFERAELRGARRRLVARLPLFVGHAVDVFPTLLFRERDAALVGGILEPVRQ